MRFNLLSIALQLFRRPVVSYIAGQIPLLECGVDHNQGQFLTYPHGDTYELVRFPTAFIFHFPSTCVRVVRDRQFGCAYY